MGDVQVSVSFLQGKHRPMIHVVVDDEGETNDYELKKFETRTRSSAPLSAFFSATWVL